MSGTTLLAQKTHFTPKSENRSKSMSLPMATMRG